MSYDCINLGDKEPDEYVVPSEGKDREDALSGLYRQFLDAGDDEENAACRLMEFATATPEEAQRIQESYVE